MRPRKKSIDRKRKRRFTVPLHAQLRAPEGLSPLAEFIESCGEEVSPDEAIHEYQAVWCDHPEWIVISTIAMPAEERFEYEVACIECGLVKNRKGRPSRAA